MKERKREKEPNARAAVINDNRDNNRAKEMKEGRRREGPVDD